MLGGSELDARPSWVMCRVSGLLLNRLNTAVLLWQRLQWLLATLTHSGSVQHQKPHPLAPPYIERSRIPAMPSSVCGIERVEVSGTIEPIYSTQNIMQRGLP